MRDGKNILEVSALHPHYMGFIFYTGTPRYVGKDFRVPDNFPETTKRVGVFVNESSDVILKTIQDHGLDFVQLHGDESVDQCSELKDQKVRIIKCLSVHDDMDFQSTKNFRDVVDYFLFDTKGKLYGGNAKTFNWNVLSRYDQKVPFFLSGGITPDHIESIKKLKDMNLHAIDVNSGVETRPAYKDVNKIKAIRSILNSK